MEVNHHEQIDQHDGEEQADFQQEEGVLHGDDLPADIHGGTARQLALEVFDDAIKVFGNAAEVAILVIGEDIHNRLNIVLRGDRRRTDSRDRGQVIEQLRLSQWAVADDGHGLQIWHGVHSILRGLGHQAVGNTLRLSQKFGAVCELLLSENKVSFATWAWVMPICWALVRSTSMFSCG